MVRPAPFVRARMKRIPVVVQVSQQPGQAADQGCSGDERPATDRLAPGPDKPAERWKRDDRNLRARPQPAAERESKHEVVALSRCLAEAEDREQDDEAEDELRAVEPVRAGGLPGEVRRPDPEEDRSENTSRVTQEASTDPQNEEGGEHPQRKRDGP